MTKTSRDKKGAKQRILDTATELFYARGVNNVGIDEIIKRSGVAKMSLYNHFNSKDELVVAYLEKIGCEWLSGLKERVAVLSPNPKNRLIKFFDALDEWFKSPDFRGCPFINTTAEISKSEHSAYKTALNCKQKLLEYIQDLTKEAGLKNSHHLADQILLLVDGAIIRAAMTQSSSPAKLAKEACETLIHTSS